MMSESHSDTKDSVQVCSTLHVAHVHVRRVILVVHCGLNDVEGVLVVIHTFTSPFVRELLYQEVFSLQFPCSTLISEPFRSHSSS